MEFSTRTYYIYIDQNILQSFFHWLYNLYYRIFNLTTVHYSLIFGSAFSLRDVNTCVLIQVLKYQLQETYTESRDMTELKDIDSDGSKTSPTRSE